MKRQSRLYSRSFREETKTLNTVESYARGLPKRMVRNYRCFTADRYDDLPSQRLAVKVDIASMAVSLEARSPFLSGSPLN